MDAERWIIDWTNQAVPPTPDLAATFARLRFSAQPARYELRNSKPRLAESWWQYEAPAYQMRSAIQELSDVIALALVSKTVMPVRVSAGQVFSHKLAVFASDSWQLLALLSSSSHVSWAIRNSSTMRADLNYSPSDVFETFPRPAPNQDLDRIGRVLDEERREIMLRRQLGLTKLYNLVNDPDLPDAADADVARMRGIHTELDHVVMAAYGWDDLPLDHGFHSYRQMTRWTVSPAARVEILDRLLEEGHRRAALQGAPPPDPAIADDTDGTDDS
jgi:hypothetical protein